jgi:hypothetical protein
MLNINIRETQYIILTKKSVRIIEGITGPQFRYHGWFRRVVCWVACLIFEHNSYPRKDFVWEQQLKELEFLKYSHSKTLTIYRLKRRRDETTGIVNTIHLFG